MIIKQLFLTLLILPFTIHAAPVVIISGQSNACGKGRVSELSHYWRKVPDNVRYTATSNRQQITEVKQLDRFGIEVPIMKLLSRKYPMSYVVKSCRNGQSIKKWTEGEEWGNLLATIERAELPEDAEFVFIWIQGERDSRSWSVSREYDDQLIALQHKLFRDIAPMPMIIAKLQPLPSNYRQARRVRKNQKSFAKRDGSVDLVSTWNLPTPDGVHYNSKSIMKLGVRVFYKTTNNFVSR